MPPPLLSVQAIQGIVEAEAGLGTCSSRSRRLPATLSTQRGAAITLPAMEYRPLGATELRVSPLCLGTAFRGYGRGIRAEGDCVATIERAVELGCNFLDCANVYRLGTCEELVGRVLLRLGVRDRLVLTSKVGQVLGEEPNRGGLSRRHIMAEIDRTLRRLQTDYVDVYFMHQPDPATPLEESLRALHDVVTAGKARYIGVSNYHATELVELLWMADTLGLHRPMVLQYPYNLVQRWLVEQEIAPLCRRFGFGLITYSPLAVGLLTDEVRDPQRIPADNHWASNPHAAEMLRVAAPVLAALDEVARELGRTPAQVAVAWLLANPALSAPILGAELPAHVDELFAAAGWELPAAAKERLDAASVESDPCAVLPAFPANQARQNVPARR